MTYQEIKKMTSENEVINVQEHKDYKKLKNVHRICFENITFAYNKNEPILKNVNVDIYNGTFTTILGPNGSGKSTLLKTLMKQNMVHCKNENNWFNKLFKKNNTNNLVVDHNSGNEDKTAKYIKIHKEYHNIIDNLVNFFTKRCNTGKVTVNGVDIHKMSNKEFGRNVAYIPQIIELPDGISIYDFIALGRTPYLNILGVLTKKDKQIINKAIDLVGLNEFKDCEISKVSGGQRQKAIVALALAQDTDIIVLDEPTTYLDIKNQHEILDILKQLHMQKKTILAILHDINQAVQYSDYIYLLKDGKNFAFGTPDEVITKENIKSVYGVDADIYLYKGRRYVANISINYNNELTKNTNEKIIDKNFIDELISEKK